ncbi:MAG: HIT domain-containing protein [Bacteroidota bacterium]
MDRLWSPWRSKYIESFANETKASRDADKCLFCRILSAPHKDEENLVLYRGSSCFVVLNLFPYNSGHLMIVPHTHTGELSGLSENESAEIMSCSQQCVKALTEALHPQGFNIGMNIGRVSGAGIDGHIHMHIVPRWNGDTNFMPVLGDTRVISEALEDTYRKIKDALRKI